MPMVDILSSCPEGHARNLDYKSIISCILGMRTLKVGYPSTELASLRLQLSIKEWDSESKPPAHDSLQAAVGGRNYVSQC